MVGRTDASRPKRRFTIPGWSTCAQTRSTLPAMSSPGGDELHAVEKNVLTVLETTLERAAATSRFRIDVEPSNEMDGDLVPAQLSLSPVDGRSKPIRIQVDHECQVTVYVGREEKIIEIYRADPDGLLAELGDLVATQISGVSS